MNPTALLLSGVLMLRHLGESAAADRLEGAIAKVLAEGRVVTADLMRNAGASEPASTEAMADAIIAAMEPSTS